MGISRKIGFGTLVLVAAMTLPAMAHAEGLSGTYRGNVTLFFSDSHVEREGLVVVLKEQEGRLAGTAGPTAQAQAPVTNLEAGRKLAFDTGATSEKPLHYSLNRFGAQWRGDVDGKVAGHAVMGRATLLRDPD